MALLRLTRRYRFSAAHRLQVPAMSALENRRVYGKCNNPYGHGHDYTLEVTLAGDVDPRHGRLFPVAALDRLVRTSILDGMDRHNLNTDVDEFATLVPTTENLALVVARRLSGAWAGEHAGSAAHLEKVRIWETKRNIFEVPVPSVHRSESHL